MKLPFYFIFLIILIGCRNVDQLTLQKQVDSLSQKWAPDKREAICNAAVILEKGNKCLLKGETIFPASKTMLLDFLKGMNFHVIDSFVVLPDKEQVKKPWGVITLSVANLRSKPKHSAELISQATLGTPVKIFKSTEGWLLIQTPDRYISWTNSFSVKQMSESEFNNWKIADKLIFMPNEGYIYVDKGKKSRVSDIVMGSIIRAVARENNLYKISLPDDRTGYLEKESVSDYQAWKKNAGFNPEEMVSLAKSFMGLPYLWGGFSAKALDCSGFMKILYFMQGTILARDASLQALYGTKIDTVGSFVSLKAGDLLFFGNGEVGPKRITHVGLYIGGKEFIHEPGMVCINSFDSSRSNFSKYRKNNFICAKRVNGSINEAGIQKVAEHSWY